MKEKSKSESKQKEETRLLLLEVHAKAGSMHCMRRAWAVLALLASQQAAACDAGIHAAVLALALHRSLGGLLGAQLHPKGDLDPSD